jgi:hypothetical protein
VVTGLTCQSAGPVHMLGTGLTGGGDRSDRCELKWLHLLCFQVVCMHSSRWRCIGSGGACMCAGGALCGLLTVYFGTPSMFITLWFGFDYGTNPPLGTLII